MRDTPEEQSRAEQSRRERDEGPMTQSESRQDDSRSSSVALLARPSEVGAQLAYALLGVVSLQAWSTLIAETLAEKCQVYAASSKSEVSTKSLRLLDYNEESSKAAKFM